MAEIKHGMVTVSVPDELAPPDQAGNMSPKDVRAVPKPPRGFETACEFAADAVEKVGERFTPPAGVTAESLRTAAARAADIDRVIVDLEYTLSVLEQAPSLRSGSSTKPLPSVRRCHCLGSADPCAWCARANAAVQGANAILCATDPAARAGRSDRLRRGLARVRTSARGNLTVARTLN